MTLSELRRELNKTLVEFQTTVNGCDIAEGSTESVTKGDLFTVCKAVNLVLLEYSEHISDYLENADRH